MTLTARGTFDVDISQRPPDPNTEGLGQVQLSKTWNGEIEGHGTGLMISGGDPGAGTAGYVAMEIVRGRVRDRTGGFALQQYGTMRDGESSLVYEIVPGSGAGELAGIRGTLAVSTEGGDHHYTLTYEFAPAG
jgi:hypothetical protein